MSSSQRASFVSTVLSQMHSPYRWGGKGERDPSTGQRVFDCSGLVTWALHEVGGPDWRATHHTGRLWTSCARVSPADELLPGDLVLYHRQGDPVTPEHVMVVVGGGVVVGASGGGSRTLTLADAARDDARVKSFSRLDYRARRMPGIVRLPFTS
ncbi:NlpC/P60 family protein [Corallococcus macrosporus]|uniref:Cell wall-associated hydrolase (Invasion-associated protein)-like protein n=1 Tax=Myxococcus fulvus (strain ATCC BAA-855 / HW-1) TaxID=483219 RepID=F8C6J4_MYXFH|nr:NlpC/P60 family protein [Corallococcus macrosporus]AEI65583.1 cell wall-associated hydrolase (invasion- associated protein)-like protein [Corallococcus macrosporus]